MSTTTEHRILEAIAKTIDIPDSAYDAAGRRYRDLDVWFAHPGSFCAGFDPHIYAQGSFRLGTVNRPLGDDEAYDLDLACKLRQGVSKITHTQEQVKTLVGNDVKSYRKARRIDKPVQEKHRCWRLEYADDLSFHIDIVPCIPEEHTRQRLIEDAIIRAQSSDKALAKAIANLSVNITDDRLPGYGILTADWLLSNPEGYALWFESRMRLARVILEALKRQLKAAEIKNIPVFKWKTPLQRCVQMFKRHRDIMFADKPDVKPISIIITTLAARAYQGEPDLWEATRNVLEKMGGLVNPQAPRVPNPVNPAEDFADKWSTQEGRVNRLEENFHAWLAQARADFEVLASSRDTDLISEMAGQKLNAHLKPADLRSQVSIAAPTVFAPKTHDIVEKPARPWRRLTDHH